MDKLLKVLQWDAALTAIDASNKLAALILVLFQDGVHPVPFTVAVEIGNSLMCSERLISRGRDALNPKSKLSKLKASAISLGLLPKGTALSLSESPGGVKVFLLICGLKVFLKGAAPLGDMLYEMALDIGVQNNWPASASSLTEVVDALLAYTPRLTEAAVEHLRSVGVEVQRLCPPAEVPRKMYNVETGESLGKLINSVFRHQMDEHVSHITLTGSISAMYIIALLTWLLPDDVCAHFKNEIIRGPHSARIKIELQEFGQETAEWTVRTWKKASFKEVVSFTDKIPFQDNSPPRYIPWQITRQFSERKGDTRTRSFWFLVKSVV